MTLKIIIPSQLHSQDATSFSSEMKPLLRTCTNAFHTEFDVTFTANDIYTSLGVFGKCFWKTFISDFSP